MKQRKYFKHRITDLETIYAGSQDDFAVLEELEEELVNHRTTARAKKLLEVVQGRLNSDVSSSAPIATATLEAEPEKGLKPAAEQGNSSAVAVEEEPLDWDRVLDQEIKVEANAYESTPLENRPQDILDAWTILEALSPQSYKKPKDLIIGYGSVAYLKSGQEPWVKGEKSRPKNNLYYMVYLGAVDLERATEQLLTLYQDKRIERSGASGLAPLGVILLDKKGVPVPETGLALSSFGWAYARAMQGHLDQLKHWELAEKALKEGLERIIYPQDDDGQLLPFTLERAAEAYRWLLRNCEISERDTIAPDFAIRLYQPFSKGEPDTPLLNSFYLDDLQRAKRTVQAGKCGKALAQYLGIEETASEFDVLKDKLHIEKALQPKNMPAGRWPGKGRYPLVLLQQTAVNLAMEEFKDGGGVFSVNGPPGTGKTTLLRDIVASVLVERAKALYGFADTDQAFEHAGQMKLGNGFAHLYKLDDSLRGHEMLVASTNNKAVENVSKELPLRSQVAEDIDDFNYFKTISDALSEDQSETWGSIAAVMGNSKNRSIFIDKAWWNEHSGLKSYFLSITGQIDYEVNDDGEEIIPRIIEECDPPASLAEAKQRWGDARQEFADALKKAEDAIAIAQKAYEFQLLIYELKAKRDQLSSEYEERQEELDALELKDGQLVLVEQEKERTYEVSKLALDDSKKRKPWFLAILFNRQAWKAWKTEHHAVLSDFNAADADLKDVKQRIASLKEHRLSIEKRMTEVEGERHALDEKVSSAEEQLSKADHICGGKLVTPELWSRSHDEQQKFAPNFTDEVQRFRDDVFVAAIKLHKAFIDASSKQLRQNLGVFFSCLSGGSLPQDKQAFLPHLWSSAFLLTPVVSTAFASVGRMLKNMPDESLGWLLIDEAGQATPQAAVGAMLRAKRVMSVGDPLQIEPVVTMSPSLVEGISKHMGVDPDQWMAPDASVQTVSDKANIYGTMIPRDLSEIRIGTPLLVHRRCEDPMFSMSNKLAYNGLMVAATISKESDITALFGVQSAWFDVKGSAEEKWSPEEGDYVCELLLKACEECSGDPDIFVITPFRNVAARMRQRMTKEAGRLNGVGIEDANFWIRNNIGTVHTFQGKEAKAVILLLGAPSPAQNGARNWATSNVNLLNVAVSRAKQNFYVVGNKELWGDLGNMKLVCRYLDGRIID